MTVAALIAQLHTMPPQLPVAIVEQATGWALADVTVSVEPACGTTPAYVALFAPYSSAFL